MKISGPPDIAVEVAGTGPLLVFLHGVGGNRHNWADQLAHFARRFTAIAWDARGYGDSDDAPDRQFTDFADDLARVITHFGGPAHLVGLSMGGRIALDCWRRYPHLVASLTLADTSAGAPPSPEKLEAFMALRRKPLLEDGKTPADIAPGIVASIAGPAITPAAHARLIASHAALRPLAYLDTLAAVTRFTDFPPFDGITVPVLVIVGEHDRVATPDYAASMAAAIPGARLHVIPGAGHVSNIEAPAAFNAALDSFLAAA
jgi:pimeloyl-ACP methyl ester carboxylesterase